MNIWQRIGLILVVCWLSPVSASDHADPIKLKTLESGITGLFAFPDGDRLVLILGVRRALTQAAPYELKPFTYTIAMDLHSRITYTDAADVARFGGTVVAPEDLSADATIVFQLNDQAEIDSMEVSGLNQPDRIQSYTGVRDDPFIFPRFFGTNVIAMVVSIPYSAFPVGQQDWVIWATSRRGEEQIDHVGRSNRTMLPRLDILNTLHPSEHVAALKRVHESPTLLEDVARVEIMPLFALRPYDFFPDVMIFTTRRGPGFPNGRRLTDDVAALTCEQGDCLLWELSYADSPKWPRQTVNDKPFLSEMPYLAEPWPTKMPSAQASLTTASKVKLALIGLVIAVLLILPWVLYLRCRLRARRA